MGMLADDLNDMGLTPTGRESPVSEDGNLWTNGYELVCDDTGIVIEAEGSSVTTKTEKDVYRYQNSGRVKLPGGFVGSYDWGNNDNRFRY